MKEFYARRRLIRNATEDWCGATNTLAGIGFRSQLMCCQCKRRLAGQHVGGLEVYLQSLLRNQISPHLWQSFEVVVTQMKELHARPHKPLSKRSSAVYKHGRSNKYFTSNFRGNKIKTKVHTGRFSSFSENIYLGLSSCHVLGG